MKRLPLLSSILAFSLAVSAPAALGHVGHGDEFQAEGGVNRVEINAQTDALLGIQVSPIESAADGSGAVMIPVSSLVEDNGRQLVFVEYESFYEPVDVVTGETQGEFIEILEGLAVGEQLVSQGSLSLYAESRKTQSAKVDPSSEVLVTDKGTVSHAEADAQGLAHSHAPDGSLAQANNSDQAPNTTTEASNGFPIGLLAAIGAGAAVIAGTFAFLSGGRQKGDA